MNNPVGIFFMAYAHYMKAEKGKTRKYLKQLEGYDKLEEDYEYLFELIKTKTKHFEGV